MKITELRIGNWITDLDALNNRHQTQVQHLDPDAEHSAQPILLTEEWLIKFGFKKHSEQKQLFFLDKFRFNLNVFTVKILRACDKAGESQHHECGYPILTDMISCGYVHQLQNLYFALTGEELKLNDSENQ